MSNGVSRPYGMIAEFRTAADILHAAQKVRDAGYRKWDVFTPFPVHGMDHAMGLKNSKVGWFSFLGGVTGYATGMLMIDRKSTRLNSSHRCISYAVFCLKKKKKIKIH